MSADFGIKACKAALKTITLEVGSAEFGSKYSVRSANPRLVKSVSSAVLVEGMESKSEVSPIFDASQNTSMRGTIAVPEGFPLIRYGVSSDATPISLYSSFTLTRSPSLKLLRNGKTRTNIFPPGPTYK